MRHERATDTLPHPMDPCRRCKLNFEFVSESVYRNLFVLGSVIYPRSIRNLFMLGSVIYPCSVSKNIIQMDKTIACIRSTAMVRPVI